MGGQESIWKHPAYHTIDGEDYMDALHFHLNETGDLQTIDHNWWLDQYGNLIGVTNLDRTDYAVLKDLIWVNGGRDGGYAEATLIYMDGSEETVTVNTIDGVYYDSTPYWRVDDATPELDDSHYNIHFVGGDANVSSDSSNNGFYDGYALYNVYTNDDGTVNLEGWNDKTNPDTAWIAYADGARIDIDGSTIRVGGTTVADVDNSTRFVVNNGDGTYSTYTGTANLPDFAAGTVEVFWSTDGTFTQNVYVKNYVEQATDGRHLFSVSDAHSWKLTDGDAVVYGMNVIVDGVERFILTEKENVIDLIEANTGKLMHVDFQMEYPSADDYGYVTNVWLVNEGNDGINDGRNDGCNYLKNSDIELGTNAIKDNRSGTSYNLAYATEIIYSDKAWEYGSLKEAVDNGCDVWVVDDVDGISSKAFTVYVGTALSDDDTITVATEGKENIADIAFNNDTKTYTVTLDDRNTAGKLTISADNDYALYKVDLGKGTATLDPQKNLYLGNEDVTVSGLKFGDTITVTVYPENGVGGPTTYTINVSKYVKVDGAITDVKSTGGSVIVGGSGNLPMYSNFQDAITHVVTLNSGNIGDIAVTANNALVAADLNASNEAQYTKYLAKDLIFGEGGSNLTVNQPTFSANAQKIYFANGTSDAIQGVNTWESDWTYVLQMSVRPNGANSICDEVVYVAFQVK